MRRITALFGFLAASGLLWQAVAGGPIIVSQRNRSFQPNAVELTRGDTMRLVNDDGELLHHAYVKSSTFSYDSGEQEPGSKTDIVFPVAGQFTMLCGIHPKMRLDVTVK